MALKDLIMKRPSDMLVEQHERNGRALLFWAATIEDGDEWDEVCQGIYEAIQCGWMEVDDTGRRLKITELGKARVETKFAEPS